MWDPCLFNRMKVGIFDCKYFLIADDFDSHCVFKLDVSPRENNQVKLQKQKGNAFILSKYKYKYETNSLKCHKKNNNCHTQPFHSSHKNEIF